MGYWNLKNPMSSVIRSRKMVIKSFTWLEPQVNAAGAVDVDPDMFKDIARKLGVEI